MANIYRGGVIIGAPRGPVRNGLQLYLDAGNLYSYPGTGNTWYDISGNNRHFSLNNTVTWTSNGRQSYIRVSGTDQSILGPNSDTFNLANDHTVEIAVTSETDGKVPFSFFASSASPTFTGLHSNLPEGGLVMYDINGSNTGTNNIRLTYSKGSVPLALAYYAFKNNTTTSPYVQILENNVSKATHTAARIPSAGTNITWKAVPVNIGNTTGDGSAPQPFRGNIYSIRLYNRALTDYELLNNWLFDKTKLGL